MLNLTPKRTEGTHDRAIFYKSCKTMVEHTYM